MKKYILPILVLFLILVINVPISKAEDEQSVVKAKVVKESIAENVSTEEDEETQKVQKLTVRIEEGEYKNEEYEMEYILSENSGLVSNVMLKEGDAF